MCNYPTMSTSEEARAPWNEPLDKTYEVTVCSSVIDTFEVTVPDYEDERLTRDALKDEINKIIKDTYENVDDFEVIEINDISSK